MKALKPRDIILKGLSTLCMLRRFSFFYFRVNSSSLSGDQNTINDEKNLDAKYDRLCI